MNQMIWQRSHRADLKARLIADRHYNRQKVVSPQFVPPGRCCVLYARTSSGEALWVTSWPFGQYVKHAWPNAWVCSAFRNENAAIASTLILQAISATRAHYGDVPAEGMITFLNERKVRPTLVRGKEVFGWTWMRAGFRPVGRTKGGLLAFHLAADHMPEPDPALDPTYNGALL